jgi:uncharacterized repeat protein (TIGR01451 family)
MKRTLLARRLSRRSTALAVATALGLTLAVQVVAAPASLAAAADPLTKTGIDVTTGSTSTVTGGDTVRYTLSASNPSAGPSTVQITDPLSGGQTLKPGSLLAPPGYTREYSTDGGATYSATEPSSGVNAVRATGTNVPGSDGADVAIDPPSATLKTSVSQGDGFQAIFYKGRIYNVHHHTLGAGRTIDCHVQATGAACPTLVPGQSAWPVGGYNVLPTAGTDLTTSLTLIDTSSNPFAYFDDTTGRLIVPVGIEGATDAGVVCIDLSTEKSCGYTTVYQPSEPVGTGDGPGPAVQTIAGGAVIGTKLYVSGDTGQVFCVDVSTPSPTLCGGPFQTFSPTPAPSAWDGSESAIRTFDGVHLYQAYKQVHLNTTLVGCVDVSGGAMAPCAGWTNATITGTNATSSQLLPVLNAAGAQTGICTTNHCYDLTGAAMAVPYPLAADLGDPTAVEYWGHSEQGAPAVIGTKVYYTARLLVGVGVSSTEQYVCHDFAAAPNTVCDGFNAKPMPNDPLEAYTLTPDPANPHCLWEIGDQGIFDVLDANNGVSAYTDGAVPGCAYATTHAQVTLAPSNFHCDGTANSAHYGQLELTGLPAGFTFNGSLTLTNQNGTSIPVPGGNSVTEASFPMDLSSIAVSGTSKLTASLELVVADDSAWTSTSQPHLRLTATGEAAQVCFKVLVPDNCDAATSLTNTATLRIDGTLVDDATFTFGDYRANPHACNLPTAAPDSATTPENTPVIVPVLTNDTGTLVPSTVRLLPPGGGAPTTSVTIPGQGTFYAFPDGTVGFQPAYGFIGTVDTISYQVADQNGNIVTSTVSIVVTPLVLGTKSATPTHTGTIAWSITKLVDGVHSESFDQSTARTVQYSVTATKTVHETYGLSGSITLRNVRDVPLDVQVADTGLTPAIAGSACTLDSSAYAIVPANGQLTIGYHCTFNGSAPDASTTYRNNATVTYNNIESIAVASDSFTFPAMTLAADSAPSTISVTDAFDGAAPAQLSPASVSDTYTWTYNRTLSNSACHSYANTATIVQTGQTDTASIALCMPIATPTNTGGHTMGWWQNKNGQALLKNNVAAACSTLNSYLPTTYTHGVSTYLLDAHAAYYAKKAADQAAYYYDRSQCTGPTTSRSYLPAFDITVFTAANASKTGTRMVEGQWLTTALNTATYANYTSAGRPTLDAAQKVVIPAALQSGLGLAACDTIGHLLTKSAALYPQYATGKTTVTSALITLLDAINNDRAAVC